MGAALNPREWFRGVCDGLGPRVWPRIAVAARLSRRPPRPQQGAIIAASSSADLPFWVSAAAAVTITESLP
ncbi:unnamed protein product [Lampetra fluviatilis]